MKKIVMAVCMLALAATALSAAPKKKKGAKDTAGLNHPYTYVIDLAEAEEGSTLKFYANEDYYKADRTFNKIMSGDMPQKGDTIEIHFKGVSDVDLPGLMFCLTDDSPAANYWTNLISQKECDRPVFGEIKAGVPFEGTATYVFTTKVRKNFKVFAFYDHGGAKSAGWAKVGKKATIKFEKTGVKTTDTSSMAKVVDKTPKELTLNLADSIKLIQMEARMENGKITSYGANINIPDLFDDIGRLPVVGDKITIYFEGTSDRDIDAPIIAGFYESTPAVNWWAELASNNWIVWHEGGIKAGEVFKGSCTFEVTKAAKEGCGIQLFYEAYDGAKASSWIYKK